MWSDILILFMISLHMESALYFNHLYFYIICDLTLTLYLPLRHLID